MVLEVLPNIGGTGNPCLTQTFSNNRKTEKATQRIVEINITLTLRTFKDDIRG